MKGSKHLKKKANRAHKRQRKPAKRIAALARDDQTHPIAIARRRRTDLSAEGLPHQAMAQNEGAAFGRRRMNFHSLRSVSVAARQILPQNCALQGA